MQRLTRKTAGTKSVGQAPVRMSLAKKPAGSVTYSLTPTGLAALAAANHSGENQGEFGKQQVAK